MVSRFVKRALTRVFISYGRDDHASVIQLQEALEAAGAEVLIDTTLLSPGDRKWQKTIKRNISRANYFIYVATKRALKSEYVTAEIMYALADHVRIIPFWIRGERWVDCAPLELLEAEYIDARREGFRRGIEELIKRLGLSKGPGGDAQQEHRASEGDSSDGEQEHLTDPYLMSNSGRLTAAQINAILEDIHALQRQGRTYEAIEICEDLLLRGVYRADLNYVLGLLYEAVERWFDASKMFLLSRYDTRYAVSSCYELGRCANAFGDPSGAVEFFNQAIDQIDLEVLTQSDADQLIDICDTAAHASRRQGDHEVAQQIFDKLVTYLRRKNWETARKRAEILYDRFKKKWPPATQRRHISESRPLEEQIPQRLIDPIDYFSPTPPNERGAANLSNAARSGVWQTPPSIRIVSPRKEELATEVELRDGDTQPVSIVRITQEMEAVKPAPMGSAVRPKDLLDEALDSIFGTEGNLHNVLEQMPPMQRGKVARAMNWIKDLLKSGQLTAACGECMRVHDIAPEYFSIYALLAETYVRLDQIEEAVQEYVRLADLCLAHGHVEDAVATYQRIRQLAPNNLSYRDELYALQTQMELTKATGPGQSGAPTELSADNSLTFLMPLQNGAQQQEVMRDPTTAMDLGATEVDARAVARSEHSEAEQSLPASTLVEHDVLPQWLRSAPQTEARSAMDAMRQIDEQVAAGQLDQAGVLPEQAKLVIRFEENDQIEEAICILREMARVAPDNVMIQSRLARNLISQGYLDAGMAEMRRLASLYEASDALAEAAHVYQSLAEVAWSQRKQEEALRWQRQAICHAIEDIPPRQRLVRYCIGMDRGAEAIEQQTLISHYYYLNRQWRKAVVSLNLWIMLDRQDVEAYDLLGQAYLGLGDDRRAEHVYRKLAKIHPSNPLAQMRLRELAARRARSTPEYR